MYIISVADDGRGCRRTEWDIKEGVLVRDSRFDLQHFVFRSVQAESPQ